MKLLKTFIVFLVIMAGFIRYSQAANYDFERSVKIVFSSVIPGLVFEGQDENGILIYSLHNSTEKNTRKLIKREFIESYYDITTVTPWYKMEGSSYWTGVTEYEGKVYSINISLYQDYVHNRTLVGLEVIKH